MRTLYRVKLYAEDGIYVLRDGFRDIKDASIYAEEQQRCYEGEVYVERYSAGSW